MAPPTMIAPFFKGFAVLEETNRRVADREDFRNN